LRFLQCCEGIATPLPGILLHHSWFSIPIHSMLSRSGNHKHGHVFLWIKKGIVNSLIHYWIPKNCYICEF
jgi:hypothetical protein